MTIHSQNRPAVYTLYHGTVVHTPVLGELQILTNMLVGVTPEGRIDYFGHFGAQQQKLHQCAQSYFEWLSGFGANNLKTTSQKAYKPTPRDYDSRNDNNDDSVNDNRYGRGYDFVDFSKNPTKFLVPGFFDTHIHASQFPNMGVGSELPLLDWLEKYTFTLENRFKAPASGKELYNEKRKRLNMSKSVYSKVVSRTLSSGTTTASYFATIDTETTKILADLAVERGQRALIGKVCMDCNPIFPDYKEESYEVLVKTTVEILKYCEELNKKVQTAGGPKLVQGIITPRFAPSCLRELMKELGALSTKFGAPVQTHISENRDEVKLVADLFPDCDDYTSVYDSHGLLGPLTILAHAVHLTPAERKMILQKNCSILHCPSLNTFLTSGIAPVRKYLYKDNINVALGTDVAGGCQHSILSAMKGLIMVLHHLGINSSKDDLKEDLEESVSDVHFTLEPSCKGEDCEVGCEDKNCKDKNCKEDDCENEHCENEHCEDAKEEYAKSTSQKDKNPVTIADAIYMATMGGAIACDMGKELGSFDKGKWFDAQLIDVTSADLNIDVFDFQAHSPNDPDAVEKIRELVYRWVFCGDDRNCVKVWCNGKKVVDKEERWVYVE